MDEIKSIVRSTILTTKGGISLENVNQNYRALEGSSIPFRKYGFSSLKEFVQSIPKLRMYDRAGSTYVEVIPNEDTIHLSQMINKQKSSKLNRRAAPLSIPRRMLASTSSRPRSNISLTSNNNYHRTDQRHHTHYGNNSHSKFQSATPIVNKNTSNLEKQHSGSTLNKNVQSHSKTNSSQQNYLSSPVINYTSSPANNNVNSRPQLNNRLVVKPQKVSKNVEENPHVENRVTFAADTKFTNPPSPSEVPLPHQKDKNFSSNKSNNHKNSPPKSILKIEQLDNVKDPRDKLLLLIGKLNMPKPEYIKIDCNKKGIFCQVSIGKNKWISYPREAKSEVEAEILAAEQAVIELYNQYKKLHQVKITTDQLLIKQRLIEIINIHKNGIFVEQLPFYYKDKYNEALPENWINIAEECPTELAFDNGVANSTILVPYSPKISQMSLSTNVDSTAVMKKLVLPNDIDWPIYIKNFIHINEIWGVVIGENYSDEDYAMSIEMVKFYQTFNERAKNIELNNYYVLKTEDGCHRVRVDTIDDTTKTAEIFFIDFGDYELVSYNQLYVLDKRFYKVPPQAIRFSLADLEEFNDVPRIKIIANDLLQDLLCYCRVTNKKEINGELIVSGTLYDTSGDEEVNINEAILQSLWNSLELPELNEKEKICEVFLAHIELNQHIYIHVNNENLKIMNILLNKFMNCSEITQKRVIHSINYSKIYLVQRTDGQWLRVKIICQQNDTLFQVLSIDYGQTMTVDQTQLCQLPTATILLEKYPPLAYKVQLNNPKNLILTELMVERLKKLALPTDKLVCKVIETFPNSSEPVVELFKRNQLDNVLISINNTLFIGTEIDMINENNNNIQLKKRLEKNPTRLTNIKKDNGLGLLSKPLIPDIGESFDVHVTGLVSNPYHFIVQPYASTAMLSVMMKQLAEYCDNYNGPRLSEQSLAQGTLCATKHMNKWHRAYIMGTIQDQVVIYLCDTGEMTTKFNNLVLPLDKKFLKLPYQAIKAKLYGVKPILTDDWSPLVSNRFQKLVAEKDFVSIIRNVERDENPPTKLIITLELIDTSTDKDIQIHQVLIEENKAKMLETVKKI